ncbi:MAG: hemerythrin domain-containing protein [Hyphomicrobiaceae bacterium]
MATARSSAKAINATDLEAFEPLAPGLIERPLEFILAEHFRERMLLAAMRRVSETLELTREAAQATIRFLTIELPVHHRDEDEDVYPLLSVRAHPEDALESLLERLADDHRRSEGLAREIVEALAASMSGAAPIVSQRAAHLMHIFAASENRHLAIENGIVLVLARKRLKGTDLEVLSRAFKARRGLDG